MLDNKLFHRIAATTGVIICLCGTNAYAAGQPDMILNGTFTYQDAVTSMPMNTNCPLSALVVGTGVVTHMGRAAVVITDCIRQSSGVYTVLVGTITVTAANGDTITATYTGSFYPTGNGAVYELRNGPIKITSGTGRFTGVTGSGLAQATEDLSNGQGTLSASATISYPDRR